jgi:hypothetical protein
MSSLLNKLKALVNASVRGPHHYQRGPHPPAGAAQVPDLVAKETEAWQEEEAGAHALPLVAQPPASDVARVESPGEDEQPAEALEDERVVDLLKGKQRQR